MSGIKAEEIPMASIEMIVAARARLRGHARRTPLLSSPFLDEIAGRRVLVKAECLQHSPSRICQRPVDRLGTQ